MMRWCMACKRKPVDGCIF